MDSSNPYQSPSDSGSRPGGTAPKLSPKEILLSFSGRIPRRTYWLWAIVTGIIYGVLGGIVGAIAGGGGTAVVDGQVVRQLPGPLFWILMLVVVYIPSFWTGFALLAKRWHDRGKSGWFALIVLIPFVGAIWAFVECGCLRGTVGPNQYGEDPT